MIRRGHSLASRMALLAVLAVFCAGAAYAQPTVEELLGMMPAQSTPEMVTASQGLVDLGPDAIKSVCAMLVPPGAGDDVNARFLLNGLAKYVSRGDAEEARALVSGAFLQAIEAAEDPEVKAFLIRQIQVCGKAEAVDVLLKYLGDDRLVEPATQALLAIRTDNAVTALKAAFEGAEGARAVTLIKALGELRVADMADKIVPFTASDNRETRLVAYQALANMGVPQALEPLRQAYETGAPYEKAKVISYGLTYAKRLAEAGDMETATGILDALMADEQVNVRSAALSTLVAVGSASAQNRLLAAMDDPSLEYRAAALWLASEFPAEEATRQWMAKIDAVPPEVQAEIITMLGNRGDSVASNVLTQQILAEEKVVRMAAIDAAVKVTGNRAVAPMLERLRQGAEEDEIEAIKSALLRVAGQQVVKACAQALDKTPAPGRIALLGVLKERHAEIARREVFAQAKAEDEGVRLAAIDALTTTAKGGDVPRVVDLVVEAPSEAEKEAARTVLVTLAAEKPRPLLKTIEKYDGQAKADLLPALPAIGGDAALETVLAAVKSEDEAIKDAAVRALSAWPNPAAMPHLLEIAKTTDNETYHVLALGGFLRLVPEANIGPEEKVAQYKAALECARRNEEKVAAISGLAGIRTIESLQLVGQYLDNEELKTDAALAAAQIACPQGENDKGLVAPDVRPILEKAREKTDSEDLRKQIDAHLANIPAPEKSNEAGPATVEEGFVALFNGKDLTGWEGDTKGYGIEDGVIVCKPGGNLYTVKDYANFVLRFEFKLTPGANNGLAVRVPMPAHAAYDGMELQIIDNTAEKYKDLKPYQYHGSIYGVVPAKRGFLKPVGEWNEQEVIADGRRMVVKLNGEVIVDANLDEATKDGTMDGKEHPGLKRESGRLGFCGHGDVLYFRNIRVKELP